MGRKRDTRRHAGGWEGESERDTQILKPINSESRSSSTAHYCIQKTHQNMNRRQQRVFKLLIWILGVFLVAYIAGRPLYWHLNETLNATSSTCPPCHCDCSLQPLLSLPEGLTNNSIIDCMRQDPEVSEEVGKSFIDLLAEEVKQKEEEAEEKQRIADTKLLEAKKLASQYQKEADKCNSGMETCEKARERAEAALENQMKETALWELRARQRGWNKEASRKA